MFVLRSSPPCHLHPGLTSNKGGRRRLEPAKRAVVFTPKVCTKATHLNGLCLKYVYKELGISPEVTESVFLFVVQPGGKWRSGVFFSGVNSLLADLRTRCPDRWSSHSLPSPREGQTASLGWGFDSEVTHTLATWPGVFWHLPTPEAGCNQYHHMGPHAL